MNWTARLLMLCVGLAHANVALAEPRARTLNEQARACVAASTQGQTDRNEGRLLAARAQFHTCASEPCPPLVASSCQKWLAELDARIPSVVVRVIETSHGDVRGASAWIDGKPVTLDGEPFSLDPGAHTLHVEADGWLPVERRFLVAPREQAQPMTVQLPQRQGAAAPAPSVGPTPVAPPSASLPAPQLAEPTRHTALMATTWTLAGVGVASMVAYAIVDTKSIHELHHLQHTCAPYCTPQQHDHDARLAHTADALLAVGIAGLGGAAALGIGGWLWQRREKQSTNLSFAPLPGGAFTSLSARY